MAPIRSAEPALVFWFSGEARMTGSEGNPGRREVGAAHLVDTLVVGSMGIFWLATLLLVGEVVDMGGFSMEGVRRGE